jgi:hypothetical protein
VTKSQKLPMMILKGLTPYVFGLAQRRPAVFPIVRVRLPLQVGHLARFAINHLIQRVTFARGRMDIDAAHDFVSQ